MSAPVVRSALAAATERAAIPAQHRLEAATNAHTELLKLESDAAGFTPRAAAVAMKLLDLLLIERLHAAASIRRERDSRNAAAAGRARANSLDYDPRQIRAWARDNGITCPPRGRYLPPELIDAWRAHRQAASA